MSYLEKLQQGEEFLTVYKDEIRHLELTSAEKLSLLPFFENQCKTVFLQYYKALELLDDKVDEIESTTENLALIAQIFFVKELQSVSIENGWDKLIDNYIRSTQLDESGSVSYEVDLNSSLNPVYYVEYKGTLLNTSFPAKTFLNILKENVLLDSSLPYFYSFLAGIYSQRRTFVNSYIAELMGFKK